MMGSSALGSGAGSTPDVSVTMMHVITSASKLLSIHTK